MAAFTPCISLVAPEGEYHVDGGPVCSENALRFWVDFLCKYLESLQYNSSKDLSDNAKEGDVAIIITMAPDTVSVRSFTLLYTKEWSVSQSVLR